MTNDNFAEIQMKVVRERRIEHEAQQAKVIRREIATAVMQGLCQNEYESWQDQAETAVRAADALIEALNR